MHRGPTVWRQEWRRLQGHIPSRGSTGAFLLFSWVPPTSAPGPFTPASPGFPWPSAACVLSLPSRTVVFELRCTLNPGGAHLKLLNPALSFLAT